MEINVKTRTALLAIFLTFTNFALADSAGLVETAMIADALTEADPATTPATPDVPVTESGTDALPDTKYVTESTATNNPKKDHSRLYNFLLAIAAVAIATVAIIAVSNNKGRSSR